MNPTMESLKDRARRELAYANELTPAYREFLVSLVPDHKLPERPSAGFDRLFGSGRSRLFEAEEFEPNRPGDRLFGSSGRDSVFGTPAPAEAAEEPEYSDRFKGAAHAGPDRAYDRIFGPAE